MQAHPQLEFLGGAAATNLHRAPQRYPGITKKCQGNPFPALHGKHLVPGMGLVELPCLVDEILKPLERSLLLLNREAMVAINVDDKDVGYLKLLRPEMDCRCHFDSGDPS